jgi:hypothetical protein
MPDDEPYLMQAALDEARAQRDAIGREFGDLSV